MAKTIPGNAENKINYATQKQMAELLEITEFEIKTLIRAGLPKAGYNKFIQVQCFKWYINYLKWKNEHWSVDDIATVCGVSVRTIQNWVIKNSIPKKDRGAYNVRSTVLAWIKDINENYENLSGEKTLNKSRQRLIDMQAEIKQMELLQLQKTLFPVDAAKMMVAEITTIVSKKLDAFPGLELNKKFSCKSKEELLKVEKEIVHKIKTDLSKAESNIMKS
jgi:hypothetical protein